MGEKMNAYSSSVGNPTGKKLLGRLRCRWEHNGKVDLRETGWGHEDRFDMVQDRDQWQEHSNEASGSIKC
jgi:hypothetical protein